MTTARSAIGLSRDGRTLTLFTVDARGGSEGMRVGEVASMLIEDYGVWVALNLDGGGSTSLAMADPFDRRGLARQRLVGQPVGTLGRQLVGGVCRQAGGGLT